jgi:hydroxyacylglutathione hydrolase
MFFRHFYDEQLAQASYLVGCPATGEALVVDPNRNIDPYLQTAEAEGLRVSHVTETHIHADFVSGARELAQRAGARLHLSGAGGPDWCYAYAVEAGAALLGEGSTFRVGRVEITVLHTPGHTPEHLTLLVTDTTSADQPMGALTGDFLFVGDVGRPDLLERAAHIAGTMELGARQLFRSLQRFRQLPDFLQIWPGHGAGSACGKALGAVPQSTLGYEKRFNWAFAVEDEDAFVAAVLAGQPDPPRYFGQMKRINRDGPRLLGARRRPDRLPVERLATLMAAGATVVDTRPAQEFALGAVPGTINIPLNRGFATWSGSLVPYDAELYLLLDDRRESTVDGIVRQLAGIGLDRVGGYFGSEVLEAWRGSRTALQTIPRIDAAELRAASQNGRLALLDVRNLPEWAAGHLPGSSNIPVADLEERLAEVPRDRPVVVHCQSGSRAAIAASLLRARGVADVQVFSGGYAEWSGAGYPVERPGA